MSFRTKLLMNMLMGSSSNKNKRYSIGVVGYVAGIFDIKQARQLISKGLVTLIGRANITDLDDLEIVSGLTNVGIPALAYKWAKLHDVYTVGIACEKAMEYPRFSCDMTIMHGNNWGDESPIFLDHCDAILRVGGGKQSIEEIKQFKAMGKPTLEYELARED